VSAVVHSAKSVEPEKTAHPEPARGRLRVGTSFDYAPFSSRDSTGKVQGFDAEIAEQLARDLSLDLAWVAFRWPTLQAQIERGEFDVAMAGVTWQPTRAVVGTMTRAVARGGPCLLGDPNAPRIAVNRGGVLESWSRAHLADRELITVEANQTLPDLLASGRVGAIVTDSFERRAFARPEWNARCEPPLARKVYWLAPNHVELAARFEAWLSAHRERLEAAQIRWFGERQPLSALANLGDLLARRMAFMPLVAAAKAKQGLPIADLAREKVVLDATTARARSIGLPETPSRNFFALQIELSKAVQQRSSEPATLDLAQQIRPALDELGERILAAVVEARSAGELAQCTLADLALLSPWLNNAELAQLLDGLRALAR
jgi:cyclohexadienyl dehydratase